MNIITLSHGCAVGWLSPFLPYLQSTESHLTTGPLTPNDVSWIGSLLPAGGFIGTIMFGTITEKLGKKKTMFLLVIPHIIFWCLVFFSSSAYHLYIARLLAGITGGGTLRTISLYIAEISESRIRGMLGSFLMFALSTGILMIFTIGTYVKFFYVPVMMIVLPTAFVVSLFFLHDTPHSLLTRRKPEEAFKSLKFYRSCGNEKTANEKVMEEFELIKKSLEIKNEDKLDLKDFRKMR